MRLQGNYLLAFIVRIQIIYYGNHDFPNIKKLIKYALPPPSTINGDLLPVTEGFHY